MAAPQTAERDGQLDQLTALRGLACMVVLMGHVVQVFNYSTLPVDTAAGAIYRLVTGLFNAEGAVLLFFVLSGCVLAMSLRHVGNFSARIVLGFYVKRVFRLYPLLWLATFVAIASVLTARCLVSQGAFAGWLATNLQSPVTLAHTLLSMAGIRTKYDGPMWSLRVELIYSALFPLIYVLVRDQRARYWFIAAALGLAALPIMNPQFGAPFCFSFALGALIPLLPRMVVKPHGLMVLAAIVILCYDRSVLGAGNPPERVCDIVETIASFVIVRSLFIGARARWLLSGRAIVRLGDFSFSIYLLHLPVLLMIFTVLQHYAGLVVLLGHPVAAALALGTLTAVATIALSFLTYTYVELPLHVLGRRLGQAIAGGGAAAGTRGKAVAAGLAPLA